MVQNIKILRLKNVILFASLRKCNENYTSVICPNINTYIFRYAQSHISHCIKPYSFISYIILIAILQIYLISCLLCQMIFGNIISTYIDSAAAL